MKKLISVFCAVALVSVVAFAQPQHKKGNHKAAAEEGDDTGLVAARRLRAVHIEV